MFQSDVGGNLSNLPAVPNENDKKLPHLFYLQVSNHVLNQLPSTSMTIKNDAERKGCDFMWPRHVLAIAEIMD